MTFLKSRLIIPLLLLILIWLGISVIKNRIQLDLVNKELAGVEGKINSFTNANERIERLMARMKDLVFIKQEAKKRLNYKYFDENVAYIYSDEGWKTVENTDKPIVDFAAMSNYKKWWLYVTGQN